MSERYVELRGRALAVTADLLGPDGRDAPVLGVLMDLVFPDGAATVLGLADGTTSLYHSGGGGIIGGGEHPQVAEATRRWVAAAAGLAGSLEPAGDDCPVPTDPGSVQLVVLTTEGPRSGQASEPELEAGGHPLSPLFVAGHDVITQLRLVDESR